MTDKIPEADFVSVIVLDRPIVFKKLNELQLTLVHRIGRVAAAASSVITEGPGQQLSESSKRAMDMGLDSMAQLLTMVEKMAVDPIDQAWLVEQMLGGELTTPILQKMLEDLVGAQVPPEKPAKKATRAR